MINFYTVSAYCKDDISLIENYEKAVNDPETWDCHHRLEELGLSRNELIEQGLYFNRPASELIFMTHSEHMKLHNKGENSYWYGKRGKDSPFYDKPRSEETRQKIRAKMKAENNPMYGKNPEDYMTPEVIKEKRQKQRQSNLGKIPWNKGMTKEEMKNYKKK